MPHEYEKFKNIKQLPPAIAGPLVIFYRDIRTSWFIRIFLNFSIFFTSCFCCVVLLCFASVLICFEMKAFCSDSFFCGKLFCLYGKFFPKFVLISQSVQACFFSPKFSSLYVYLRNSGIFLMVFRPCGCRLSY